MSQDKPLVATECNVSALTLLLCAASGEDLMGNVKFVMGTFHWVREYAKKVGLGARINNAYLDGLADHLAGSFMAGVGESDEDCGEVRDNFRILLGVASHQMRSPKQRLLAMNAMVMVASRRAGNAEAENEALDAMKDMARITEDEAEALLSHMGADVVTHRN